MGRAQKTINKTTAFYPKAPSTVLQEANGTILTFKWSYKEIQPTAYRGKHTDVKINSAVQ